MDQLHADKQFSPMRADGEIGSWYIFQVYYNTTMSLPSTQIHVATTCAYARGKQPVLSSAPNTEWNPHSAFHHHLLKICSLQPQANNRKYRKDTGLELISRLVSYYIHVSFIHVMQPRPRTISNWKYMYMYVHTLWGMRGSYMCIYMYIHGTCLQALTWDTSQVPLCSQCATHCQWIVFVFFSRGPHTKQKKNCPETTI